MSLKKVLVSFVTLALVAANAASDYKLNLSQSVQVGGTTLKAGSYKFEMQGDKVVIKTGKDVVAQASAKVENGSKKFSDTAVSTKDSKLESISVGGTTMKIVVAP
jgi:hypothetical protein